MQNKLLVVFGIVGAAALSIGVIASQGLLLAPQTNQADVNNIQASGTPKSSIEAEASEKELWEELGLPYDPNEGEPTEETAEDIRQAQIEQALEEEQIRIDEKERATVALVMADDRIKEYVKDALQVDSDFVPSEYRQNTDTDKVTLTVTGKEILEGSWETSYTSKLTDMFALEIEVKDGTIVSIEQKPLVDLGREFTYTDAEKAMIKTALQDPAVQAALKVKEDAGKTISISIRSDKLSFPAFNCPMNQCALIFIREVNSHATLVVWLNTEEGKVVKTEPADGW